MKTIIALVLLFVLFSGNANANTDYIGHQLRRMADAQEKANTLKACEVLTQWTGAIKDARKYRVKCLELMREEVGE